MQETRLHRTETRSREGCQEFREPERSGCVESLSTVNGQFECQQDCSRVSHSLKEVFLSRIVVSWRSEPLGKTIFATKCLRMALSCATVVPNFYMNQMLYITCTFLQALHHNCCNRWERKLNRPFTRPIFPCVAKNENYFMHSLTMLDTYIMLVFWVHFVLAQAMCVSCALFLHKIL